MSVLLQFIILPIVTAAASAISACHYPHRCNLLKNPIQLVYIMGEKEGTVVVVVANDDDEALGNRRRQPRRSM